MKADCANAKRVTIEQAGRTYNGHWHGTVACFEDGSVFIARSGWEDRYAGLVRLQCLGCENAKLDQLEGR